MKKAKLTKGVFVLLLIALMMFSSLAQTIKEPYQQAAESAALAMRQGNFDEAIKFYTEAIKLFPKVDDFTPQNRKINLSDGKFTETPYIGLEGFYFARANAFLHKHNIKESENDYKNAMTVLEYEITKNLNKAKKYLTEADIRKEKALGSANSWNSDLVRAVFAYEVVSRACEKAQAFNYRRRENYARLKIPLSADEQNISEFDEIIKNRKTALYGKAETYAISMIEVGNKAHSFWALKSSNELITAFPDYAEAYRLRAKVNRYWNREAAAVADEQKAEEFDKQK